MHPVPGKRGTSTFSRIALAAFYLIGALCIGTGIFLKFWPATARPMLPQWLPLRDDPNLMIFMGMILILPVFKFVIRQRRQHQKS